MLILPLGALCIQGVRGRTQLAQACVLWCEKIQRVRMQTPLQDLIIPFQFPTKFLNLKGKSKIIIHANEDPQYLS